MPDPFIEAEIDALLYEIERDTKHDPTAHLTARRRGLDLLARRALCSFAEDTLPGKLKLLWFFIEMNTFTELVGIQRICTEALTKVYGEDFAEEVVDGGRAAGVNAGELKIIVDRTLDSLLSLIKGPGGMTIMKPPGSVQ